MKLLLFTIISLCSFFVTGQDTLFYRNGNTEIVSVIELKPTFVKYTKYNSVDDNIYYKSGKHVQKVIRSDGETYYLESLQSSTLESPKDLIDIESLNSFSIDIIDPIFRQITVYYTHTFPKAKDLTIGIPLSASSYSISGNLFDGNYKGRSNPSYYNWNKIFSSGIDVMSRTEGFLYGASFEFGKWQENLEYIDNSFYPYPAQLITRQLKSSFKGYFLRTGYAHNITPRFFFSILADIGISIENSHHLSKVLFTETEYVIRTDVNRYFSGRLKFKFGINF